MSAGEASREGGIVFMMHFPSNSGFALEKLEETFSEAALFAGYSSEEIFFSYPRINLKPRWMSAPAHHCFTYDYTRGRQSRTIDISAFVAEHNIKTAFVFDLQPDNPLNGELRAGGVNRVFSYWGAPMSSVNSIAKLLLKRLEVVLRSQGPDLYIFESEAMKRTATHGRGVPANWCRVIPTGVDPDRFMPRAASEDNFFSRWDIPPGRKVFVYAGHMEERKGVHVIIEAMDRLVADEDRDDIHFLAFGDRPGERERFYRMMRCDSTREYVTFGGYYGGLHKVFPTAYAGIIASSGWDSWPMSMLEMASCGIPLLVSDLQGLREFVENGDNGWRFSVGDSRELMQLMKRLADDSAQAKRMGARNREKVLFRYTRDQQVRSLAAVLKPA